MPNTLVQFRVEDSTKSKASDICQRLGLDLPGYLRVCIARLIQENGIPFQMKLDVDKTQKALEAIRRANLISEENGLSEMSL
ncbi:MAG: type II toxin-antitoxin system RelB/DinJ family antitoxin, partial [Victivallales bacterium]|nr:type II toxin-antitoxin system RelB/DinJ family antitoxin [Victivallales bacterium]